jgi:hypothetical protein
LPWASAEQDFIGQIQKAVIEVGPLNVGSGEIKKLRETDVARRATE